MCPNLEKFLTHPIALKSANLFYNECASATGFVRLIRPHQVGIEPTKKIEVM